MPYFNVMVYGKGINMPFEGTPDPVIGFLTTRRVKAESFERAQVVACALVLCEWQGDGAYAALNRGAVPTLQVEECWEIGWFEALTKRKPDGYTFFANDDE